MCRQLNRLGPGLALSVQPQSQIQQLRHLSRSYSDWANWHRATSDASSRVQVYTSQSRDPYLNLSAEHFLLQNSHPDSVILFLYANSPSVVIGRNQNPWLEVNLGLLGQGRARETPDRDYDGKVSLVRRRSGGGTVFHDAGNVNYSVICPPWTFDRNKHAKMVVRALASLGVYSARVTDRHDIVVDVSYGQRVEQKHETFKVSGSAYKLTRLRSLHHGTCLLSSPNLGTIGRLLHSPASPYIKARGVESVRSKIRNVNVATDDFREAVIREFRVMYGAPDVLVELAGDHGPDFSHESISRGSKELKSREWIYNQTPQFTFSTSPSPDDPRDRPEPPAGVPQDFSATVTVRHGEIQEAHISGFESVSNSLRGQHLHQILDWRELLEPGNPASSEAVGSWFNQLLGTVPPQR